MEEEKRELNEMERLERNIIKSYNRLLKTLLEEGDMDTLEKVITDEAYCNKMMDMHTRAPEWGALVREIRCMVSGLRVTAQSFSCDGGISSPRGCRTRNLPPGHG